MEADIIVVDDGSTDRSTQVIDDYIATGGLPVTLLHHARNRGFAAAVNTGIRAAKTPYVLLLNNDTEAAPQMTKALYRTISGNARFFSVQAKLLQERDPVLVDSAGDYYCALGWAFARGKDLAAEDYTKRAFITSSCAGAAIYRRDLLMDEEAVGLFDEAHYCYLEDVDIGIRALRNGYRNVYEPRAIVLHAGSATSGSRHNAFKEELAAANSVYLIYKNMPFWLIVMNAPLFIVGFLIKVVYFSQKGLGASYRKGLGKGVQKCYLNKEKRMPAASLRRDAGLYVQMLLNCVLRVTG